MSNPTEEQIAGIVDNALAITEWAIRAYGISLIISNAPDLDPATVKEILGELTELAPNSIVQAGSIAVVQVIAENGGI